MVPLNLFLRRSLSFALAFLLPITASSASAHAPVGDPALTFVNSLLARMTLEEKIGQMSQLSFKDSDKTDLEAGVRSGTIGSFLFVTDPAQINRLQHIAVEESRLHIPLIFGFDVIHGYRTIYPIPLAVAASWDPSVAEAGQSMAAREASAAGINWTFAPMVDIARDARWGRIMEGAGEDPYLGARMAEAQVRGFQGPTLGSPNHILACVKHFAGYGAAEGGRDYDQSNISDEQLYNVYLPPFHAAQQAGAGSFMSAYMDVNGVPATGNTLLLHDILRTQWHFNGFVVSDWEAVKSLTNHGFAAGPQDAAIRAVNAGLDMEMTSTTYRDNLPAALKQGKVNIAAIDTAARNVLLTKYRMGLFTHPYAASLEPESPAKLKSQHEATHKAALQTAVLLRNEGHVLPLQHGIHNLAVIGPLADSRPDTMGSWSLAGNPADVITVAQGLRNKLGEAAVHYAPGVEIQRTGFSIFDGLFPEPKPTFNNDADRGNGFRHAIELIKSSDAAVLVLGEANNMSGERASRSSLSLPGNQQQLLEAAAATGKPIVLVLLNGRPLDITWASTHIPSILEAWYPGSEGGNAVADLLFGDANPSGKLPVTWPRSAGQEPFYYSRNLTQNQEDDATRYWDLDNTPLYPFGYGLSYASFQLGPLSLDSSSISRTGTLHASVELQNTSNTAGDEVVQLYTHQRAGSASRPIRELKGFTKVHLAAGEKRTISVPLRAVDLAFWSPQTHASAVEPGTFDLWIGNSSNAATHTTFNVTP